jgi:hypothetical protein
MPIGTGDVDLIVVQLRTNEVPSVNRARVERADDRRKQACEEAPVRRQGQQRYRARILENDPFPRQAFPSVEMFAAPLAGSLSARVVPSVTRTAWNGAAVRVSCGSPAPATNSAADAGNTVRSGRLRRKGKPIQPERDHLHGLVSAGANIRDCWLQSPDGFLRVF